MATTSSTWQNLKEVLDELNISRTTFDLREAEGPTPRCYKLPNDQLCTRRKALVQEIIPSGELSGSWAKLRRGHTEDTGKRPAVFYTYIKVYIEGL